MRTQPRHSIITIPIAANHLNTENKSQHRIKMSSTLYGISVFCPGISSVLALTDSSP